MDKRKVYQLFKFPVINLQILMILGLVIISNVQGRRNPNCINPQRNYGYCIKLPDCEPLFSILHENPISRSKIKFLQMSTCGFDGQTPKVCCVQENESNKPNQTKAPEPPPPPPKPIDESNEISERTVPLGIAYNLKRNEKDKLFKHPNFKLLPTVETCGKHALTTDRITGGTNAGFGAYPWIVLLAFSDGEDTQLACGGTLISERYVVSASHCVHNLPGNYRLAFIRIGEYDQSKTRDCDPDSPSTCAPPVQDIEPEQILEHPDYDKNNTKSNDISLIRLKKPVKLGSFASPICLPHLMDMSVEDLKRTNLKTLIVAGWGRTIYYKTEGSDILQELKVPLIPLAKCNVYYSSKPSIGAIDDTRFCAGAIEGKDSCKGDSGGPIMQNMMIRKYPNQQRTFLFGVVSLGPSKCGAKDEPALYTKMTHYLPWILDTIRP